MPAYETIRPEEGERSQTVVRSGTLERKHIDHSATNAQHRIVAQPEEDVTIRDLAFTGEMNFYVGTEAYGSISSRHVIYIGPVPEGVTVTIENVWAGDGAVDKSVAGFAFVNRNIEGEVIFRNIYAESFVDNGIYASAHGKEGKGTVKVENSYLKNNTTANVRLSHGDGPDTVRDSVLIADDEGRRPRKARHGPGWTPLSRGVWGRDSTEEDTPNGPIRVIDCQIDHRGSDAQAINAREDAAIEIEGGNVAGPVYGAVSRSDVGDEPDLSVPAGVPTTPAEALGVTPPPQPPEDAEYVSVQAVGDDDSDGVPYSLQATDGRLWKGENASSGDELRADGTAIDGTVWAPWFDDYLVSPDADVNVETDSDSLLVTVDGEPLDSSFVAALKDGQPDPEEIERRARELASQDREQLLAGIERFVANYESPHPDRNGGREQ